MLANLSFVCGVEGDGAALFSFSNRLIDASSSSLEAPITTHHMRGDANGSSFTMANKYLIANPLLFESRQGDEATSLSFAAENARIDASSAVLEALIAT